MKKIIMSAILTVIVSTALFGQTKAGKIDTVKHAIFYNCPKHTDIVSDTPDTCPTCGMKLILSPKEQMKAQVTRKYNCPAHLGVTGHNTGKCPQCGKKMNLALDKNGKCPKCGV